MENFLPEMQGMEDSDACGVEPLVQEAASADLHPVPRVPRTPPATSRPSVSSAADALPNWAAFQDQVMAMQAPFLQQLADIAAHLDRPFSHEAPSWQNQVPSAPAGPTLLRPAQ